MNFNFSLITRENARGAQWSASASSTSAATRVPSPPDASMETDCLFPADASIAAGSPLLPDDDWKLVDLSSTEYTRRCKELMQLINDLRSLGGETVLGLPSVIVIGDQSAGKSSLVEAVSGVSVPRDSKTCTRCPMECTMSSNATSWSCKIKLRFHYDPFGCSATQQREISFGPTVTDKSDVDIWLRRAQAAILNPGIAPESFYKRSIQDLKDFAHAHQFSRNVISVFIEDPDATDFSFVDLPGLIQNEDPEVLELVHQLTRSYISQPNTIILTMIPMNDDMQNQQSVRLAKEADPDGERTIGILTKPDTLRVDATNAEKFWLDVIEGHHHRLKHGYYCVRLPDDTQRAEQLSRSELQRIAAKFFDMTTPWSSVADRGRFGIPAFVSDISVFLVKHINKIVPQLREDVERLLVSCLKEISRLPKPLETNPQTEVLVRVNAFCDTFKSAISGVSSDKSLAQRNRALYTVFARSIRETFPDFRPFEQPTKHSPIYDLESEEPVVVRVGSTKEPQKCTLGSIPEPVAASVRPTVVRADRQPMGVLDVRKTILDSIAWELPGNIPYEAKIRLIKQFTSLWSEPAEKCLTSIHVVLNDVIQQFVEIHFGQFKVLQQLILNLIRPDVEEHKRRALVAIKETLGLEITLNYTQNLQEYKKLREKWLTKYRYARRHHSSHMHPRPVLAVSESNATKEKVKPAATPKKKKGKRPSTSSSEQTALDSLAESDSKSPSVKDLADQPHQDQFDDELAVMADVRAYFTIACKRIVDHVPLKIEQSLHQALAENLSVNLLQRLMIDRTSTGDFADRMKELMSEDPATEAKRTQLEATHTRLQEMKRRIASFAKGAM